MTIALSEVARMIGAPEIPAPSRISGWSVDTRTLQPGDLFFALRGPVHDGHQYIGKALDNGAAAIVAERGAGGSAGQPLLMVNNSLTALQTLARQARRRWGGTVIAVTGSAGKTTTRDIIARLLSTQMPAGGAEGNLNNHVGLPLSILRLPDDCRVAVLEMGMNHAGEIRDLARIAGPDIGVVTNIGSAHMEYFDSIENIALAKRELIEALGPPGAAVLNADDPLVSRFREIHPGRTVTFGFSSQADVRAGQVSGARFRCDGVEFENPLPGRHGILNVLAGIAVCRIFGIPAASLPEAVRSLTPGSMRGERLERGGVVIFNDSYNANPEAVRAMIDLLQSTPARRRLAVLGEMLELGRHTESLHREIGRYAAGHGIDVLVGIRGAARHMVDEAVRAGLPAGAASFFEDSASAGEFVRSLVREGDAVLFKGSRGVRVERALERVLA